MSFNLGRYQKLVEIGHGAQGVVYKGYDTIIDRIIAAKTIANFKEAKNLGKLHHPNITMVYDVEHHEGTDFIVMEYINGVTIKKLIDEKSNIPLNDKVSILIQAARALHYAHQNGLIHKDIKPANIMIAGDNQVKIMDFGIAETVSGDRHINHTAVLVTGTPFYMSPEQILNEPLNRQTDIYSLCILAYEFLCGKKPFRSDTLKGLFRKILIEKPEFPTGVNIEVAPELGNAILKGIARKKEDRYLTASDFADDLELYLKRVEKKKATALHIEGNPSIMKLIKSLREQYPFFSDFSHNEMVEIITLSTLSTFLKSKVIFRENTIGDRMFIVIEGEVAISKIFDGNDKTIAVLKAGECFGEMAIIDHSLRSATATAQTNCTLLDINEVVLRKTDEKLCLKLYRNLSAVLAERLREENTRLNELENKIKASENNRILCVVSSSLSNSGLMDYLLPVYEGKTSVTIETLTTNSGLALEIGKRGKADAIFVSLSDEAVKSISREDFVNVNKIMAGEVIIVGPPSDPAGVGTVTRPLEALRKIAANGFANPPEGIGLRALPPAPADPMTSPSGQSLFVSRGDASGVHEIEALLWDAAGIDPSGTDWYLETNQSMEETLKIADKLKAYTVSDKGTFASVKAGGKLNLDVMLEGDLLLSSSFTVMAVNPVKHPHVNYRRVYEFIKWLMSEDGQKAVQFFKKNSVFRSFNYSAILTNGSVVAASPEGAGHVSMDGVRPEDFPQSSVIDMPP